MANCLTRSADSDQNAAAIICHEPLLESRLHHGIRTVLAAFWTLVVPRSKAAKLLVLWSSKPLISCGNKAKPARALTGPKFRSLGSPMLVGQM